MKRRRIIGEGKKRVSRSGMRIQGREGRQSVGSGRVFPPLMEARRRLLGAAARAYKTDDRKKKKRSRYIIICEANKKNPK